MTHREIFEHLLNGGTIVPDCKLKYIYLNDNDILVDDLGAKQDIFPACIDEPRKIWTKGLPRPMNIQEAVSYAERGYKIARKTWGYKSYIISNIAHECFYNECREAYIFSHDDIKATDWQIYTEEGKNA
jgi:hypothetical protein